jgi:hypothetical protein
MAMPWNRAHSARASESAREIEQIKALVGDFGDTAHNPVKDRIADLRRLRDSGAMSSAEFAVEVAGLLGGSESVIG